MSGFTKNGTDLNDLLMQSNINNNSGTSGFIMANGQDLYVRYGKWDGLARNQAAATGYTVDGADINTKINKINPTFQASLSGTFEYTGEVIQPTITASPAASIGYHFTYKGNKVDAASYLAVALDFELPTGYEWDTNYPQGSFTITQKPITISLSGTGSFEYNGGPRSMGVLYGGKTFTSYTIVSGSLGPITNVSQSPISVTVRANGNYTSDQVSGSITITPKPITFSFSNDTSIVYNGSSYSIGIIPSDSNTTYSITNGSVGPITNVSDGSRSVTVQANGNYSGSATSGTLQIIAKAVTVTINGTGTFAYTGETFTMNYSLNDSVPESSISTSGNTFITNGGSITYNVSLSGNYSGSASGTINIVQAFIDTQPTGGSGTSVSLSVTASGAPSGGSLSYQWQLNNSNISGATSSSYTATSTGSYKCIVTYTFNGKSHSVTSNAVDVTISSGSTNNRILYIQNVNNGYMQIGINSPVEGDYRIILLEAQNSTVIQDLGKITIDNLYINTDLCFTTYGTVPYNPYPNTEYQLRLVPLCPNPTIGSTGPDPVAELKSINFNHYDGVPAVSFICIREYNTVYHDCEGGSGGGGGGDIEITYAYGECTQNTRGDYSGTAIMHLTISGLIFNDNYALSYSLPNDPYLFYLHTTFIASGNNITLRVEQEFQLNEMYIIKIENISGNSNNNGQSTSIPFNASEGYWISC